MDRSVETVRHPSYLLTAWLTGRRNDPPSMEELALAQRQGEILQRKVAELDARAEEVSFHTLLMPYVCI